MIIDNQLHGRERNKNIGCHFTILTIKTEFTSCVSDHRKYIIHIFPMILYPIHIKMNYLYCLNKIIIFL